MTTPRGIAAVCVAAMLAGCGSMPRSPNPDFCTQLERFARASNDGEARSVTLGRGGIWMVDHYKFCSKTDEDEASGQFCDWLLDNTSTEFMEKNINSALSCLQGQKISGYTANNGIEAWSGRALFYSPQLDVGDVKVEIEYSVQYFDNDGNEDFLKISARPD